MTHEFRLHNLPFDLIKSWKKKIEVRLFDEKRQKIKLWDEIIFISRENWEEIKTKVFWLFQSNSFENIYKNLDESFLLWYKIDEIIEHLYKYYSKEDEEEFWVLGIFIEKI